MKQYLPLLAAFLLGTAAIWTLVPAQAEDKDDTEFFKTAAMSDLMEIETSKLAVQNATNAEIKNFAAMMVKDHGTASTKLKTLAAKKKVTLPASLDEAHLKKVEKLKGEEKGKKFDEAYIDMQEDAHDKAVDLFEKTAKDSKDADVRAHATATLPILKMHSEMAGKLDSKDIAP